MLPVYLLVERSRWDAAGVAPLTTDSLAGEGFIHCAFADQVERSANKFFAQADGLVALRIEPGRLTSPLKVEPSGSGALFPHIYGPVNREAVVAVVPLSRGPEGRWLFQPPDA